MSNLKIFLNYLAATLAAYVASLCMLGVCCTWLVTGHENSDTVIHIGIFVLVFGLFFTVPAVIFNWLDVNCWKASAIVSVLVCLAVLGLMSATITGDLEFAGFIKLFVFLMIPGFATACAATFGFAEVLRTLES